MAAARDWPELWPRHWTGCRDDKTHTGAPTTSVVGAPSFFSAGSGEGKDGQAGSGDGIEYSFGGGGYGGAGGADVVEEEKMRGIGWRREGIEEEATVEAENGAGVL